MSNVLGFVPMGLWIANVITCMYVPHKMMLYEETYSSYNKCTILVLYLLTMNINIKLYA